MNLVLDSSALLAIVLDEEDAEFIRQKLHDSETIWMSPINWWEAQVRARALCGEAGEEILLGILNQMAVQIESITAEMAQVAFEASKNFSGRPSRLNLGDCFAYALAKAKDAPLLFKGNDFVATDVKRA